MRIPGASHQIFARVWADGHGGTVWICDIAKLVGGDWNMFDRFFPSYWEFHDPNWHHQPVKIVESVTPKISKDCLINESMRVVLIFHFYSYLRIQNILERRPKEPKAKIKLCNCYSGTSCEQHVCWILKNGCRGQIGDTEPGRILHTFPTRPALHVRKDEIKAIFPPIITLCFTCFYAIPWSPLLIFQGLLFFPGPWPSNPFFFRRASWSVGPGWATLIRWSDCRKFDHIFRGPPKRNTDSATDLWWSIWANYNDLTATSLE